ncbi:UNVERIFIED_CONTAM: hypothetical protein RKD50_005041 [Streptomyces canus]
MNPVRTRTVLGKERQPRQARPYDGELGAAVARAQDGDENAFAVAYRIMQPGLLGYLRGIVGEDAEDVASDAWLEIARNLGRFKGDGAGFRGWTATIARTGRWTTCADSVCGPGRGRTNRTCWTCPARTAPMNKPWKPSPPSGPSNWSADCRRTRPRPCSCGSSSAWTVPLPHASSASARERCARRPTEV